MGGLEIWLPLFLATAAGKEWMVTLRLRQLYAQGKSHLYPQHQIRSGRLGDKINHFSLPRVVAGYISRNKIFLFEVLSPSYSSLLQRSLSKGTDRCSSEEYRCTHVDACVARI
jgi:hypothetical protein